MTDSTSTPTHEQIAQRAYEIFMERGQPAGQDLAHWLEAERQLRAADQQPIRATAQPSTSSASSLQPPAAAIRPAQSNGRTAGNGRNPARPAARK